MPLPVPRKRLGECLFPIHTLTAFDLCNAFVERILEPRTLLVVLPLFPLEQFQASGEHLVGRFVLARLDALLNGALKRWWNLEFHCDCHAHGHRLRSKFMDRDAEVNHDIGTYEKAPNVVRFVHLSTLFS